MLPIDKRKNDDEKPKRRPGSRLLVAVLSAVVLIGGIMLWVLMRPEPILYPQYPAARLYYTSNGAPQTVNLQTGERTQDEAPQVVVEPDAPADIVAAQALIEADEHMPLIASPDHEWLVGWKHISHRYEWELRLYDQRGLGRSRSLGVFHGINIGPKISWSPYSQWITFSAHIAPPPGKRMSNQDSELWLLSIPTGKIKRLTHNSFRDSSPDFSPDGTMIAYNSMQDGYNRLYIMDLTAGQPRLVSSDVYGYAPVWSPDSQWLAYMTNQVNINNDIWIIRPDGTDAQPITTHATNDEYAMWLP